MFLNTHTHFKTDSEFPEIINLTFKEAKAVYNSDQEGLFSVGIHPWEVDEITNENFKELVNWLSDKRFVFVGESGLDKFSKASFEKQKYMFEQQVFLSEKIEKPLIIHCVGYFNELFKIKQQLKPQQLWVIHGFRGKPQLAQQVLKNGCAISFGEHFNVDSVAITPFNKLFVETDESKVKIEEIYNELALIKLCTVEELNAGNQLLQLILNHNRL